MKNGSRTTVMYEKDRSWSKVKLQTVAKPGLTPRNVCVVGLKRNRSLW